MRGRLPAVIRRCFHRGGVLRGGHASSLGLREYAACNDVTNVILDSSITPDKMHSILISQASRSALVQRNGPRHPSRDYETENILKDFGALKYFSNISSSPEKCKYLVEFERRGDLSDLLNQGKDGAVENHMIEIAEKNERDSGALCSKDISKLEHDPKLEEKKLINILLDQATMDDQIKLVVERNMMSSNEIRSRYLFLHVLNNVLQKHLNTPFHLRPFGSGLTGTGMPGSDLDVLLITKDYSEETYKALPEGHHFLDTEKNVRDGFRAEGIQILHDMEKVFQNFGGIEDMKLVLSARVPILKFRYSLLDLSVDISVNQFHGDNFSSIINWYIRFDERVLPVLFVIRKWAEARSLLLHGLDYRGFTPFILQMTVLVYLMRFGIIPPMQRVGRIHRDKMFIHKTPKDFLPKSQNTASVSELICGFFDYFASYGLKGKRLCPYIGLLKHRRRVSQKLWIVNPFAREANVAVHCSYEKIQEMEEEIKKTARTLVHRRQRIENRGWGIVSMLYDRK